MTQAQTHNLLDIQAVKALKNRQATLWVNPTYGNESSDTPGVDLTLSDIKDAYDRLERFRPYFERVFHQTKAFGGRIESDLRPVPKFQALLEGDYGKIKGKLYIKMDSHLPVSGSIKARGGFYEVLKHAEDLAISHGLVTKEDAYDAFDSQIFKDFFSNYSLAVGSTGNLGLSIGLMGAALGFKVEVHMSADAKDWKKASLRAKGVKVLEYDADYSLAVDQGRRLATSQANMHFIDDEKSLDLFLGYSVAALRLKDQLAQIDLTPTKARPLHVYLPCGVGGGPGGITFGLKAVFGDLVTCYFAEPQESPCVLLGMATGLGDKISVQDIGLTNLTLADGLAVGRPSKLVCDLMATRLAGIYTLSDQSLLRALRALADSEDIWLEPSALAGAFGPFKTQHLLNEDTDPIHIMWATGGSMVPKEDMIADYRRAVLFSHTGD